MPKFPSAVVLTLSAGFALLVLQACPNPLVVPPPGDSKPLPPPEQGPLVKDTRGRTLGSITIQKNHAGTIIGRTLRISESVTEIPSFTLPAGLENLTSLSIPAAVNTLGPWAFARCTELRTVTIPPALLNTTNPNAFPPGTIFQDNRGRTLTSALKNKPALIDPDGSKTTVTLNIRGETVFSSLEIPPVLTSIPALRFANRGLTSINIPPQTTAIANRAFFNNTLTELNIPEQVSSIGPEAFAGNPHLQSVTLSRQLLNRTSLGAFPPGTVFRDTAGNTMNREQDTDESATSIPPPQNIKSVPGSGEHTHIPPFKFANRELSRANIPASVQVIGEAAYKSCGLTSLTIPPSVQHIGKSAFRSSRLTSLTIPDSVTSIAESAFRRSALQSVTISNSVTRIANSTFRSGALQSVRIPDSVTSIGMYAFFDNRLESITIPDSVKSIEESAFRHNRLESVTIPDSVRTIGDGAFAGSPLKTVMISPELLHKTSVGAFPSGVVFKDHGGKEITRWKTLPPITDENGVTSIIRDDKNRILSKHLKISPTLKAIPPSRFADSELTDVTIPDEIHSIGEKAFAASPNLKSVTISQRLLNRTNPNAFPPGVVFRDFSGKMIISILKNKPIETDTDGSKTMITVNDKGKTIFRSLEVSPTLKTISPSRFADKKLTTVTIPDSVRTISEWAFARNPIRTLRIPESVTAIGDAAFQNSLLREITIPNSVKSIGKAAFMSCSLRKVTISSSMTIIENSAFSRNFITDLTIPTSVKIIGEYAFEMNELPRVTIPDSVTAIRRAAFRANKLTEVTIPDSVTHIAWNAFAENPLKTVTISQELLNKTHPSDFPAGAVFKNHAGNVITRQR